MKSKILIENKELHKDTIEGLITLSKIDRVTLEEIYQEYEKATKKSTSLYTKNILSIAKKVDISTDELDNAILEAFSLIGYCSREEDSIENIIEDLVGRELIKEEIKKLLLSNLLFLQEKYNNILKPILNERNTISRNFNILTGISTQTVIVPEFKDKYDSRKHNLKEYTAKIDKLHLATQVNIIYVDYLDKKKTVNFNLTELVLDGIINDLLAAKIHLNETKKHIGLL